MEFDVVVKRPATKYIQVRLNELKNSIASKTAHSFWSFQTGMARAIWISGLPPTHHTLLAFRERFTRDDWLRTSHDVTISLNVTQNRLSPLKGMIQCCYHILDMSCQQHVITLSVNISGSPSAIGLFKQSYLPTAVIKGNKVNVMASSWPLATNSAPQ